MSKNTSGSHTYLSVEDCELSDLESLLNKYKLCISIVDSNQPIPGSFWGDSEAGLINNTLFVRNDTPIHSLLHEACHFICMDNERRSSLHTNAKGDYDEENAVCYLQILLSEEIKNFSKPQIMKDMDNWGYTFRLGSTESWFEQDAEDALSWLRHHKLLDKNSKPNFQLRQ